MRILIVGSGGREHALAWRLQGEAEVIVTPGNAGIAADCETFPVKVEDRAGLMALADRLTPNLTVVGPEDPLIAGLADQLRLAGHRVVGPGADGAALEGSKALSKDLMAAAGIPTAEFQVFRNAASASDYVAARFGKGHGVAVKASGAALGKGVVVCDTPDEAYEAIRMMLVDRELGEAGSQIVVEDRLVGFEFSLLTLANEAGFWSLPVAMDHKRARDGDRGPNTGGMGTVSPVASVPEAMVRETEARVVAPALAEMARRGIEFRGVLFSGLLVQDGVPYCLEYNVRFGDPETQSVMRRLGPGLAEALRACAAGEPIPAVPVLPEAAVTVVMASLGYPGRYATGLPITIGPLPPEVVVFHSGTALATDGTLVSAGGRVLGVSATGATVPDAQARAYAGVAAIDAPGLFCRGDIGAKS